MLRAAACCAALMLSLAATPSLRAAPCEGTDCKAAAKAKSAKPLQLGKFTHPGKSSEGKPVTAKPAAAKSVAATKPQPVAPRHAVAHKPAKQAVAGRRAKSALPPVAVTAEPLVDEAAAAFASQSATSNSAPDVRVVAGDEFNEIDRAAAPAWPETTGRGSGELRAAPAVKVVDATDYNDIDRKELASLANAPEQPPAAAPASLTWIERFWGMIQHTFAAMGAAYRYLFG